MPDFSGRSRAGSGTASLTTDDNVKTSTAEHWEDSRQATVTAGAASGIARAALSERLDCFLIRTGYAASRREAAALVSTRRVRVNGRLAAKGLFVTANDKVEVAAERGLKPAAIIPDPEIALEILYSDPAVVVVNKPAPMACHPLRAGELATAMNGIVARFPETSSAGDRALEGGLVHRLDNGTSGALLIARSCEAARLLRQALQTGAIRRRYLALVCGEMHSGLRLDAPVAHHPRSHRRMTVGVASSPRYGRAGRPALTEVEPLRHLGHVTLVAAYPHSGSRHQIRLHLANAGFPIVGDRLYGGPACPALVEGRFWLHLEQIAFSSPASGEVAATAQLPADLVEALNLAQR